MERLEHNEGHSTKGPAKAVSDVNIQPDLRVKYSYNWFSNYCIDEDTI